MMEKYLTKAATCVALIGVIVLLLLVIAAMAGGIMFFCRYIFGW